MTEWHYLGAFLGGSIVTWIGAASCARRRFTAWPVLAGVPSLFAVLWFFLVWIQMDWESSLADQKTWVLVVQDLLLAVLWAIGIGSLIAAARRRHSRKRSGRPHLPWFALVMTVVMAGCCGGLTSDTIPTPATAAPSPPATTAATRPTTTTSPSTENSTVVTTSITTSTTATTVATTTTVPLPELPDDVPVEALAWGLFCRDLADAGFDYPQAVAYWQAEGRPARMDADEDGIPCETVYPTGAVTAYWGDPLPTGLKPGPGSGWRPSTRTRPVTPACCSINDNGPVSPPLPPEEGPFPHDGAYAVTVTRDEGQTDALLFEIRRWLPCSKHPEQCSPDSRPGDVYADPDHAVTRTIALDQNLTVVLLPIPHTLDGTRKALEGNGTALAMLLRRIDAAAGCVIPAFEAGIDPEIAWAEVDDVVSPFSHLPTDEFDAAWAGSVIAYRGPEKSHLVLELRRLFDYFEPPWMYGEWFVLEITDGHPILYIEAGQIAG